MREVLKKFQWNKYEIDAYCALVENGPCNANDISIRANIPSGRVFDILKGLVRRGYVKKRDGRPAIYDAQNPKYVLDDELKKLTDLSESAKESVMPLWEARAESNNDFQNAAIVESFSGIVTEIRNFMNTIKLSFTLLIEDISWIGKKDLKLLGDLNERGIIVKIVSTERSRKELESIAEIGVITKITDSIKKSYCISDHLTILWISDNMKNGTVIKDERLAEILELDFENSYGELKQMEVDSIAI